MKVFETRIELLNYLNKNLTIAELGVFEGEFSKEIHNICLPNKLYLVDLFDGYFGSGDKDGNNHHYYYYYYVQLEDKMKIMLENI